MKYEIVIKNGIVADGTGNALIHADVAAAGGKIAAVGKIEASDAEKVFDASGMVVSPGFIDAHAHSENSILRCPDAIHKISQGITMEITGHCGDSCFPVREPSGNGSYADLEAYRARAMQSGIGIDQANMIGHGNLREWAVGEGAGKVGEEELLVMRELLRKELQAGGVGLSSGLEYAPGMYSDTAEMIPLAALCRQMGHVYSTHMRSEGSRLLEAVEEALTVARESGAVTVISHIKACGKPNHGKVKQVIQMMQEANAAGARVYGDCYPYPAGCTGLTIVLPQWTLEHGTEEMLAILASDAGRQKIREWFSYGTDVWENRSILTGWENIFVSHVEKPENRELTGKSIQEIAKIWGKDEITAFMDLLLSEHGYVPGILKSACEEDIQTAYACPRVMVCSDSVDVTGSPHPRLYGSHTRFLARYADISTDSGLAHAVWRMTGLPAKVYGLLQTGTLEVGKRANITVWNPAEIMDKATFENPIQLSEGIEAVFVGGKLAYRDKEVTGVRSGKFIF